MSEIYQRLSHSRWDCKYHVVFVPKRRRRVLFGQARRQLGEIFHALARQKECQIVEGHLTPDRVHMCIAIPPKYPVVSVIGFLKGGRMRSPNEVGVAVKDGVATLMGSVDSYTKRWAAEQAAHRVRGVLAVANDIEIRLPISSERTNADIAAAAVQR